MLGKPVIRRLIPALLAAAAGVMAFLYLQQEDEVSRLLRLFSHPLGIAAISAAYTASFLLKAWAWRLYTGGRLNHATAVQGLFASLFVNHVLPVKAGDLVRAGLGTRGGTLGWGESLQSVAVLRSLDLLTLGALAATGAVFFGLWEELRIAGYAFSAAIALGGLAVILLLGPKLRRMLRLQPFLSRQLDLLQQAFAGGRGWAVWGITAASWVLEGAVVYGTARIMGVELGFAAAVWVTAVTVAGQVFHFTPGGLGTYESVMTAALSAGLGLPLETAFGVALATHGYKFIYSYGAGGILIWRSALSWREVRSWTAMRLQGKSK